jgi:WD40 repeat protein
MAHKVFICHSSKDKQIADAACAALEAQRIPCWIAPRDILAGDEYGKAIVDALTSCQIVLLIFSRDANNSPQVRREIERAVSKGKIIVPFRIEDVLPSDAMEFALSNTHWLDALTPPIERYIVQLCKTISRLLQRTSEAESPLWEPRDVEEDTGAESNTETPKQEAERAAQQVAKETKTKPEAVREELRKIPQQSHDSTQHKAEDETQNKSNDKSAAKTQGKSEKDAPPELTRIEKLKCVWRELPRWQRAALSALASVAVIAAVLLSMWMHYSLTLLRTIDGNSNVASVAFSPDGRTLASGSFQKPITLWDVATGQQIRTMEGQTATTTSVAFSPDGRTLASGSWDHTIKLFDVATGHMLVTLQTNTGIVESVALSRDGRTLASGSSLDVKSSSAPSQSELKSMESQPAALSGGSWDNAIQLWDLDSLRLLRTLQGDSTTTQSVAFSPDGRVLAAGRADHTIQLWDVTSGQLLRTLAGHSDPVSSVAFSPDGRTLVSGAGDLKLWDVASGQLLRTLSGHSSAVTSVAFSPDGQTLASGSWDHSIKLWDVASGHMIRTQKGDNFEVASVAFSPDGRTLASGGTDNIKLWDVSNLNK